MNNVYCLEIWKILAVRVYNKSWVFTVKQVVVLGSYYQAMHAVGSGEDGVEAYHLFHLNSWPATSK